MKVIFNGTGSSTGTPQLFCKCAVCSSADPKNKRTRFSMTIIEKDTTILVDTPFELRLQLLRSGIQNIDMIWLTHPHSDHIAGLDDLRMVSFMKKQPLPIFGSQKTLEAAKRQFPYMFTPQNEYIERPFLIPHIITENTVKFKDIEIIPIKHHDGKTEVESMRIGKFALIADISHIKKEEFEKLKGIDTLAISTTVKKPHSKHLSLSEVIDFIDKLQPKRAYLTHMNHTFDYKETLNLLPENIQPAWDGMEILIF